MNIKKEWIAIATLVLAIFSCLVYSLLWLGRLDGKISVMEGDDPFKNKKDQALTYIQDEAKKQAKNPMGFIPPKLVSLGTEQAPTTAPYTVPCVRPSPFLITVDVPNGRKLISTWYVPTENISALQKFKHIEVTISDDKPNVVTLSVTRITEEINGKTVCKQEDEAAISIMIYGVYDRL